MIPPSNTCPAVMFSDIDPILGSEVVGSNKTFSRLFYANHYRFSTTRHSRTNMNLLFQSVHLNTELSHITHVPVW